jgi:hypothetical protein
VVQRPGKQFKRPYLKKKKKTQKRACEVAEGVGSEFKLQHHKKKKFQNIVLPISTNIRKSLGLETSMMRPWLMNKGEELFSDILNFLNLGHSQ